MLNFSCCNRIQKQFQIEYNTVLSFIEPQPHPDLSSRSPVETKVHKKTMPVKPDELGLGNDIPPPAYEEAVAPVANGFNPSQTVYTPNSTSSTPPQFPEKTHDPETTIQIPQISSAATPTQLQVSNNIPDVKIAAEGWGEDPPLCVAARKGDTGLVQILLLKGADINGKSYFGKPALHHCIEKGRWKTFDELLSRPNINLEVKPLGGVTALYLLASKGNVEKVKLLVEKGANVDAKPIGTDTALYVAADRGDVKMMHVLLQGGANVNAAMMGRPSALYVAVKNRREAIVNLLLAHNAAVDQTYWGGETPFHKAAAMGDLQTMNKLLGKGANADAKPMDGNTALHDAARGNKLEVMKILLRNGASVDVRKWGGDTPLLAAIAKKNIAAVKLMLDSAGDDLEKRNKWVLEARSFMEKNPNSSDAKLKEVFV